MHGYPEQVQYSTLIQCLKGDPLDIALNVDIGTTVPEILLLLENQFAPVLGEYELYDVLKSIQAPGEHVLTFALRKSRLVQDAGTSRYITPSYVDGIFDRGLRHHLRDVCAVSSLQHALAQTRAYIANHPQAAYRPKSFGRSASSSRFSSSATRGPPRDPSGRIVDQRAADGRPVCNYCKNPGHFARECPSRFNGSSDSRNAVRAPPQGSSTFQSAPSRPSSFGARPQQFAPRNQRRDLTGAVDVEYECDDDTVEYQEEHLPMEYDVDYSAEEDFESKNEFGVRSADPYSDRG